MSSFVREAFYVDPPKPGATTVEWETWQKQDDAEAVKAKRAFTRKCSPGEMPQLMQDTITRKVDGVWRQTTAVGLTGSAEEGTSTLEPMVDGEQERAYDQARFVVSNRGRSHVRSGTEKRKLRKQRRKQRRSGKM